MKYLNREQLKNLCVRLVGYEENQDAINTLSQIIVEESLENGISMQSEEDAYNYVNDKINAYLLEHTISTLHAKGLIEVQLDDDGNEMCILSEHLKLEVKDEH